MARSVSSLADTARAHRALSPPPPPRDFLNLKSTPPSPPEKTLTSLSSPTEQLAVCSQLCRQTHLGPRPPCSCPGWHPGVKISVPEKEQAGGECFLGAEGKVTRGGRLARRGPQGGTWKPGEGPLAPTPCHHTPAGQKVWGGRGRHRACQATPTLTHGRPWPRAARGARPFFLGFHCVLEGNRTRLCHGLLPDGF